MADEGWESRFRQVYDRAVEIFDREGGRTPDECISKEDQAFLRTLGCSPQELYDFAEDWCWAREPAFEEVLEMTRIRRDYFLKVQKGTPSAKRLSAADFPAGTEVLADLPWLPRIIAKARAKIQGELPPQLMYACGADRPFLHSINFRPSEFLALVRDAGDDDRPIVEEIRARTHRA